jgi:hypothetical protein
MTTATYKFIKTNAGPTVVDDLDSIVQLDDAGATAIALLAASAITKIATPIDGTAIPTPTDPPPAS